MTEVSDPVLGSDLGFRGSTCVYTAAYDEVHAWQFSDTFCLDLTSEAEIAWIHLDGAIFVELKSMLILLVPAQHCFPPNSRH